MLTTHNANRHCRVRFYTFVGQPLTKQLYYYRATRYSCESSWTIEIVSVVHVVLSAEKSLCVKFITKLWRTTMQKNSLSLLRANVHYSKLISSAQNFHRVDPAIFITDCSQHSKDAQGPYTKPSNPCDVLHTSRRPLQISTEKPWERGWTFMSYATHLVSATKLVVSKRVNEHKKQKWSRNARVLCLTLAQWGFPPTDIMRSSKYVQ